MITYEVQTVNILNALSEEQMFENMGNILAVPYNKGQYDTDKTKKLIASCVSRGHESVLEHLNITLDCLTTIGTYKGYTRHRHCAFTIESTIFSKYDKDLHVIVHEPFTQAELSALMTVHELYKVRDLDMGRHLLPQCCCARMIMTTNIREWRHIIAIRGDPKENTLTKELRDKIWTALAWKYPFFFPTDYINEAGNPMLMRNLWGKHDVCKFTYEYGNS